MYKESTATRLKQLMRIRNIKQVDILNAAKPYCVEYGVKLNKSDLSQYISGIAKPRQDKLKILCLALDVSPAWLMGFDVPMEEGSEDLPHQQSNSNNFLIFTPAPSSQIQKLIVFNKNGKKGAYENIIPSDDVLNEINKLAQALKPYPAEQINALLKLVENGGNIPIEADMPSDIKELIVMATSLSEEKRQTLIQVAKSMK